MDVLRLILDHDLRSQRHSRREISNIFWVSWILTVCSVAALSVRQLTRWCRYLDNMLDQAGSSLVAVAE